MHPPKKITKGYYKCDKHFHLDSLLEMYDIDTLKLGIILTSGKEYRMYLSEITNDGKCLSTKLLSSDTERLLKNHKKGGQSAQRFCRIRQNNYNRYVNDVCDEVVSTYMKDNHTICIIDKLIVAGPTNIKNDIIGDEIVQKYFNKKIALVMSTDVINDRTVYNILETVNLKPILIDDRTNDIIDLIAFKYDLLIFGDEIFSKDNSTEIRRIYIHSDFIIELKSKIDELSIINKGIEIIKTTSEELRKYGGIIAERWFNIE